MIEVRRVLARPLCRGCKINRVQKPRGLCCRCYNDLELRMKSPPVSPFGNRGHGIDSIDSCGEVYQPSRRLPERPTSAIPGSPEKIAVLEERARCGRLLFHPDDLRLDEV